MSEKNDKELIEDLQMNIESIDNEMEDLNRVLCEIERLEDELTDYQRQNSRDVENVYNFWHGPEARQYVDKMLDYSDNSASELRYKASNIYDEIKNDLSRLERKREGLKDEISRVERTHN